MAVYDFERTLRYSPNALLTRSFYKPQVGVSEPLSSREFEVHGI